jgi:hypothetical protein
VTTARGQAAALRARQELEDLGLHYESDVREKLGARDGLRVWLARYALSCRAGCGSVVGLSARAVQRLVRVNVTCVTPVGEGGGLDLVVLLEAIQSVPESHAPTQQDRDDHNVQVVDEPGGQEVADRGGTPPVRTS